MDTHALGFTNVDVIMFKKFVPIRMVAVVVMASTTLEVITSCRELPLWLIHI